MSIRYYHYISRSKVDEAVGQIERSLLDRLSVELNSAFLPVSVKAESEPQAPTLGARVVLAEAALREDGQVGTIAPPGPWFSGTMTMKWSCFGRDADGQPDTIFFIGMYADILVALGGSAHHGRRTGLSEEPRAYSNSGWETMMDALRAESDRIKGGQYLRPPTTSEVAQRDLWQPTLDGNAGAWPSEAAEVWASLPGRGRDVEFVARWSDQSDYEHRQPALLGTPLYVADAPGVAPVAANSLDRRRLLPFRKSR